MFNEGPSLAVSAQSIFKIDSPLSGFSWGLPG